jgi:nucleoside-diphosphate-sugar epimerase
MTVFVTGGSGLVGSHVIAALVARGAPVRALARPGARDTLIRLGAEPISGDVTDPAAWRRGTHGAVAVVHAAALIAQHDSFERFVAVNVGGTRFAIEAARSAAIPLVHLSSVAVYGRRAATGGDRVTEDSPFQPLVDADFYARTKRLAEELVRDEAASGGLTAVALRPNVIYGERDRLFTPNVIGVVRHGIVPQVGPGRNHLACVYAGNVAAAVLAALERATPGFRAYNVTEDAPPALEQREFLAAFSAALGVRVRRVPVPVWLAHLGVRAWTAWRRLLAPRGYAGLGRAAVSFLTGENAYSAERARAELGWRPPYTTRDAIARTVAWFRTGGG